MLYYEFIFQDFGYKHNKFSLGLKIYYDKLYWMIVKIKSIKKTFAQKLLRKKNSFYLESKTETKLYRKQDTF